MHHLTLKRGYMSSRYANPILSLKWTWHTVHLQCKDWNYVWNSAKLKLKFTFLMSYNCHLMLLYFPFKKCLKYILLFQLQFSVVIIFGLCLKIWVCSVSQLSDSHKLTCFPLCKTAKKVVISTKFPFFLFFEDQKFDFRNKP